MLNCGNFGIIMVHLHELLVQKNVQHMTLVCQIVQFLLLSQFTATNSEAKHKHFIMFSLCFM